MAIGLKFLLNRLFQPFLLLLGLPVTCLPDPAPFAKDEFPPRQFPAAVWDWRDLVAFLYVSPVIIGSKTKIQSITKHPNEKSNYKVVEVGRYTFPGAEDGEHQIVVAKVEVGQGNHKYLRIERDTVKGVRDLDGNAGHFPMSVKHPSVSATDEEEGSGSSSGAIQPPAPATEHAAKSPHPSISVYAVKAVTPKPEVQVDEESQTTATRTPEVDVDVDTVQTIFAPELRPLVLVESLEPKDFYLHHLALLVGEVHDYDCLNCDADQAGWMTTRYHQCSRFADLIMRAVEKEMGVFPGILKRLEATLDPVVRSEREAVNAISEGYKRSKDDMDRRRLIAFAGVPPGKQRQPDHAQLRSQTQEPSRSHRDSILKIRQEDAEHIEDFQIVEVKR